MEEARDPLLIPGWIWVLVAMFIVGVIVALVIKRDRRNGRSHRSGHRRQRSKHESSSHHQRRRKDAPFDKL